MISQFFNYILKIGVGLTLFTMIQSCEDVIEVEIDPTVQRTIINALACSNDNKAIVKINKSTNYFDPITNPIVSGAKVNIFDDQGNDWVLKEAQNKGVYEADNFNAIPERGYYLSVTIGKELISSQAYMPKKVELDSVNILLQEDIQTDSVFHKVHAYWKDPVNEDNYYRLILILDDEVQKEIYIADGTKVDGGSIDYSKFQKLKPKMLPSKVEVQLWSISKAVYFFYKTLDKVVADNASSSNAPFNPESNLQGNALGVFNPYTYSTKVINVESIE